MDLTDEQWAIVAPRLPDQPLHNCRGRPRASSRRALNGILWVMRTASPWSALPSKYPSRKVCRRRFKEWKEAGVLVEVLRALEDDLAYREGVRITDPRLVVPRTARSRASWWWQTVVLLRSADASALLGEELAVGA